MTPRLTGHFSIFRLVFFVLKSHLGTLRQYRVLKELQFHPLSLGVMLEF